MKTSERTLNTREQYNRRVVIEAVRLHGTLTGGAGANYRADAANGLQYCRRATADGVAHQP